MSTNTMKLVKTQKKYQYNYLNVINYKRTSTFLYNFLVGAVQLQNTFAEENIISLKIVSLENPKKTLLNT